MAFSEEPAKIQGFWKQFENAVGVDAEIDGKRASILGVCGAQRAL
jgi:hypothetical protein